MSDPVNLRSRMESVRPPHVSVETIVSRGKRRVRLKRFGTVGAGAVVVALVWTAIGPMHLRIATGPVRTGRSININHVDPSPSSREATVARGTANGRDWRLVVSGEGKHHLCVRVKVGAASTGGCGLLSINGPLKLNEGTIASVRGEFVFGLAGEAISRLELWRSDRHSNLPLYSGPPTISRAKFFIRWLPRLINGSVIARNQNGSIIEGTQLQLQEERLAAEAATHFAGIHEALAFIRKHGMRYAVLPAKLPQGTQLAPHHPVRLSTQGSTVSATLELRAGKTRLYFQYGTAVFDGCGADSAQAINIMGVPALIQEAPGGTHVYTQLIWPATHPHPEGHFGIAGNIPSQQAVSLARSMMRVAALRSRSRLMGC